MAAVRRACVRLGVMAMASLLVSLIVLMFLVEAPIVVTWFIASAALTLLAFGSAAAVSFWEG